MIAGHSASNQHGLDSRAAVLDDLLKPAGVRVGGSSRHDIIVHDDRAIDEILRRGSLGAGEAWMRGWWDCAALDELMYRVLSAGLDRRFANWRHWPSLLRAWLTNPQRRSRAFRISDVHYDLGNDLFRAMLDRRMVYSCGFWEGAADLDAAQEGKLDLICRKLGLQRGDRLLDIGCGWGSLAQFAAERYGVSVVGVTVSQEQAKLAQERCAGLPVDIRLQDYRDVEGRYSHAASVGMIEHVGAKNYAALFDKVRDCLEPGGLFLLHTIGDDRSTLATDPWINRYIFPDGHLPSLEQLAAAAAGRFVVEDLHNFGSDYALTLMSWYRNFRSAWPELRQRYDEQFFRMWTYYLLSCAGAFRARSIQLWQLVLSPGGVQGGYRRPDLSAK